MKITLFKSVLLLGTLFCFTMASAQTVTGTVSDDVGPLPGASIVVKGTTNGTQSDFDGNYTIDVDAGATVGFSNVGVKTKEIS